MKHKVKYIENKKVFFNYEITDTLEAGIELFGYEVKSVKAGTGSLEGSYILVRGKEAFLIGARVSPYQTNNTPKDYDPLRNRKLILHKEEIEKLEVSGEKGKGLTVVPICIYNSGNRIKVEVGIAKGKKKFDKRETIKKRETDREIRRELKR
jgi:SsrA-binding protein